MQAHADQELARSWIDPLNEAIRTIAPSVDERALIDEYLFRLAAAAAGLPEVPGGTMSAVEWAEPAISFGPLARGTSFVVIEWELAPGACLPPHNHPNGSVCTLGLSGEAVLENYEPLGALPPVGANGRSSCGARSARS